MPLSHNFCRACGPSSNLAKRLVRKNHLIKVKRNRFFDVHQGGGILTEQAKSATDRLLLCRCLSWRLALLRR